MWRVPAFREGRSDKGKKRRSVGATVIPVLLLLVPQPALAAGSGVVLTAVTFGAVALAIGATLWAIALSRAAAKLRRSLLEIEARARAAMAERDAVIEAGREKVLMWGQDTEGAHAYAGSEELLDACLAGADALPLSQALDDLAKSGAPFALDAHNREGETIMVRGRPIGRFSALWMEKGAAPTATAPSDIRTALDALS